MKPTSRRPLEIRLHKKSRRLEVAFDDGQRFSLPAEYLRVYSPSAEVRGHGRDVLQVGKEDVAIASVEPIGNYAVRLVFDDGHDTGLYSWDLLYELGLLQDDYWARYLERLASAGHSRRTQEPS